jgi:hypothetical protein
LTQADLISAVGFLVSPAQVLNGKGKLSVYTRYVETDKILG